MSNTQLNYYPNNDDFRSANLIVMSWVADIKIDGTPGNIIQLNPAFQSFIRDSCKNGNKFELEGRSIKNNNKDVTLEEFLKTLLGENENISEQYFKAISQTLKEFNNVVGFWDNKEEIIWDEKGDADYSIQLFRNLDEKNGELINTGVRILDIRGIKVPVKDELKQKVDGLKYTERFDLVCTIKFSKNENGEDEKPTGVQGIFIPAQSRFKKVQDWKRKKIDTAVGAVISRSFSHNIGSHPLVQTERILLSKAIEFDTNNTEEGNNQKQSICSSDIHKSNGALNKIRDDYNKISSLLNYINQRAELIAFVTSGNSSSFYSKVIINNDIIPEYIANYINDDIGFRMELPREPIPIYLIGGSAGLQAFCAILENFARNSHRHQPHRIRDDIKLEIKKDREYAIKIYDKHALVSPNDEPDLCKTVSLVRELNDNIEKCLECLLSISDEDLDFKLGTMEILAWALMLNGKTAGDFIIDNFLCKDKNDEVLAKDDLFKMLPIKYVTEGDNNIALEITVPEILTEKNVESEDDLKIPAIFYCYQPGSNIPKKGRWIEFSKKNTKTAFRGKDEDNNETNDEKDIPTKYQNCLLELNGEKRLHMIFATNRSDEKKYICSNKLTVSFIKEDNLETTLQDDKESYFAIWKWHKNKNKGCDILSTIKENYKLIHYEELDNNAYRHIFNSLFPDITKINWNTNIWYFIEVCLLKILIVDDRFNKEETCELNSRLKYTGIVFHNPLVTNKILPENYTDFHVFSVHVSLNKNKKFFPNEDVFNTWVIDMSKIPYFMLHTGRVIDSQTHNKYNPPIVSFNEIFKHTKGVSNKFQLINYLINAYIK